MTEENDKTGSASDSGSGGSTAPKIEIVQGIYTNGLDGTTQRVPNTQTTEDAANSNATNKDQ